MFVSMLSIKFYVHIHTEKHDEQQELTTFNKKCQDIRWFLINKFNRNSTNNKTNYITTTTNNNNNNNKKQS